MSAIFKDQGEGNGHGEISKYLVSLKSPECALDRTSCSVDINTVTCEDLETFTEV